MQDRFNFRYFYSKTIYDVFAVDFMNRTAQLVSLDRKETLFKGIDTDKLIQCTGLKDKNGKLIYEGDILNIWCKNLTKNQISEVKFCKERAAFTFDYNTDFGNIVPCTMEKTVTEIIGNIYENPELLEDNK